MSIVHIIRRLGFQIFVIFGLSILIFLLVRIIPGDPARLALGPEASEEQVANLRRELALDKPLQTQYYLFIKGLSQGKLGTSLVTRRDVSEDLMQRFPATLELVMTAMFLAILFGIPLGSVFCSRFCLATIWACCRSLEESAALRPNIFLDSI